mmetsp:Transcript_103028/g.204479  ORF Transcript_103028/g.204479 Transcript_103028/m.204479 type:complete len:616 (+) Transcript_103028:1-1848(+)
MAQATFDLPSGIPSATLFAVMSPSYALQRLLDPSGVAFDSGMAAAHYARLYEAWNLSTEESSGVLAVGSRADGMHFFGLIENQSLGGAQALHRIGSYSPRIGKLLLEGDGHFAINEFSDLCIWLWAMFGGALYGAILGILLAAVALAFQRYWLKRQRQRRTSQGSTPLLLEHDQAPAVPAAPIVSAAPAGPERAQSASSWYKQRLPFVASLATAGALLLGAYGVAQAWDGVHVAMEGHAKSANALVAVAICQGSDQMKPWTIEGFPFAAWSPCLKTEDGAWTPVLFIFDTNDWSSQTPRFALPLYGWGAALHVQLVAMPCATDPTTQELFAIVSSGFSQGPLGALGALGLGVGGARMAVLPIGRRLAEAARKQESTSFQFQLDSGAPWTIDVSSALDPITQRSLTVPLHSGMLGGMSFPEGVLTYQVGSATYVLTAGVTSKEIAVVNVTEAPLGPHRARESLRFVNEIFERTGGYKQLVGRTFFGSSLAGEALYGVTANFAKPGGIDVFDLTTDPARPKLVGKSISYKTGTANRVVLTKTGHCIFAAVPLENAHGFALFNVSMPKNPQRIGVSARADAQTYALEVIKGIGGRKRILLFDADGHIFYSDARLSCDD